MKKFLSLLIAALLFSCVVVAAACSRSSDKQLQLSKIELQLSIGEEYALVANAENVSWESNDADVATVSENGMVKGVKEGVCKITAKAGKLTAECVVTVKSGVSDIEINKKRLELEIGQEEKLFIANAETAGEAIWSTLNPNVATVTSDGLVRAVGEGETEIRASAGAVAGVCKVSVSLGKQNRVTLSAQFATLYENGEIQLKAELSDGGVADFTCNNDKVALSVDGNIVTVTKNAGYGLSVITASYQGNTATCEVYVVKASAKKLTIPSIDVTKSGVSWKNVDGANAYRVKFGSDSWIETNENFVDFSSSRLQPLEKIYVYVQAICEKDGETLDSEIAKETFFGALSTFVENEEISFYGAENASSYTVLINGNTAFKISDDGRDIYTYSLHGYRNLMRGINDKICVSAKFSGEEEIGNEVTYGYLGVKTVVDDFENGIENVPQWESVTNKFTVSHSTEVSRSGSGSLKVRAKETGGIKGGTLYIKLPKNLATDVEHTISMWVYVDSIKKNGEEMNWPDVVFSAAAYTERCSYKSRRLSAGVVGVKEWTKVSFRVSRDEGEILKTPDGNLFLVLYQNADYWYSSSGKADETEGVKTITYYIDDVSITENQKELVSVGYTKNSLLSMHSPYDTTDADHKDDRYVSSQAETENDSDIVKISVGKYINESSLAGRNAVDGGSVKDEYENAYTTKLYSVFNVFVDSSWWGADYLRFKPILQPRYANAGNGTSNERFLSDSIIRFWVKSDSVSALVFVVDKGNGFTVCEDNIYSLKKGEWQEIVFDCKNLGYDIKQLVIASTSGNADGSCVLFMDGLEIGVR